MTLDLARLKEGWDFEAKRAAGRDGRGALPQSFFETYSAMANTDGGTVVLGATERDDGSFEVTGLAAVEQVEQDLWNSLDNRQKVSANVLRREHVERAVVDGRSVLVISVPRADRKEKPIYLSGNPFQAFRRSREGDRRCSDAEVRRMLADAGDEPADSEILAAFDLADLDRTTLDAWRNLFRARQPDHPFLAGGERALLGSVGAWRRDRTSGAEGLTVAGLLMFGNQRAILDRFPYYHLDYREMVGDDPGERWQDRITLDGTWPGNVFSFFRRVFPRLTADLKVPFRLDAELVRIDSTPAHEALREALVNALIHADYAGTRGIRVFKRRTAFELVNPGTLRVPWEEARAGNASDPRNPTLQKLFQLAGFGDRAGSGVPRILQAWREQHWRTPELTENFERNETRLVLSMESLLPDHVLAELDELFGERFRVLAEAKRSALVTTAAEGRVTNRRLQQVIDLHSRDLTYLLTDLVREGFLVPHGERSGRWYTLPSHVDPQPDLPITRDGAELPTNGSSLRQSPGQGLRQAASRYRDGEEPAQRPATALRNIPWASRQTVDVTLLAICRDEFLTADVIAERLGRSSQTVRRHYLPRLVATGRLVLRYPETPNHPLQAYRAVSVTDE